MDCSDRRADERPVSQVGAQENQERERDGAIQSRHQSEIANRGIVMAKPQRIKWQDRNEITATIAFRAGQTILLPKLNRGRVIGVFGKSVQPSRFS